MAGLRHPHVLQFLALSQEESTLPVLERMDKSLDLGLEAHLQSILSDLVAGLLYLHTSPNEVVHCDIKESDLGIACTVSRQPGHLARTLPCPPGNMLPVANFRKNLQYLPQLDVFSFALCTLLWSVFVCVCDLQCL